MNRPAGFAVLTLGTLALGLGLVAAAPAIGEGKMTMVGSGRQNAIDTRALRALRPGRPLVVAHRGYSERYADNSRESFEAAIAAGADLIETDIRAAKDGVLVCVHDPDVEGDEVADLTSMQLNKKGVLRLAEVLALAKGRIAVLLDIKLRDAEFPLRVHEEVQRAGVEHAVIFGLRSNTQVRTLRGQDSDVVILGFLKSYEQFPKFFDSGGDIARLWEEDVNAENLALARGSGRPVFVTAGHRQSGESPGDIKSSRFKALMEAGIDGVLVNDPVLALGARGAASK